MTDLLEAGQCGGALEGLTQRVEALGSRGATAVLVKATESVLGEAVKRVKRAMSLQEASYWPARGILLAGDGFRNSMQPTRAL